ncbi:MAG TPA: hypothetical protein VN982_03515 [Candidatus Dormibacteraeota bacterium]|nr:hypothetical protein [Candidatus Dormibacteraeota bacterium]
MPPWKTESEKDWWHALIHESGHAVMGTLQCVRCHGVFIIKKMVKACILNPRMPKSSDLSDELRLYLAAGSAAERIVFGKEDVGASRGDREIFGNLQDGAFDAKITEAEKILSSEKSTIERLASLLFDMVKSADGNFTSFRSQLAGPVGGPIEDHWVLLNEEELKTQLKDVRPLNIILNGASYRKG